MGPTSKEMGDVTKEDIGYWNQTGGERGGGGVPLWHLWRQGLLCCNDLDISAMAAGHVSYSKVPQRVRQILWCPVGLAT